MKKRLLSLALVAAFSLGALAGCGQKAADAEPMGKSGFALNTSVSVAIYDSQDKGLLSGAFDVISKYENMFSRTKKGSDIYNINENGEADVSDDTVSLIQTGLKYCELTNGKFNIAIEPLTALWNFTAEKPKVPSEEDIKKALEHIDYTKIKIEGNHVTLEDKESGLDLGAIAKGFIADKVKEYLVDQGVKSAIINLGGNVLCIGEKAKNTPFKIGIQDPDKGRGNYAQVVTTNDISVVTSGTYERYFIEEGVTYHHILDPETGKPFDNGIKSVTIISEDSTNGDALSTVCFALGPDEGIKFVKSLDKTSVMYINDKNEKISSDDYPAPGGLSK